MRRQRGLGAIAALVVLVMLAALAAGIVTVGTVQQTTFAQDLRSARALQAANGGVEMGLYRALGGGDWAVGAASDLCPAGGATGTNGATTVTLDLSADTGFHVTVTAQCWQYNESALNTAGTAYQATQVYQIRAVACPAAACPADASAASPGYVERSRVVIATN
ncbi:MAG: MSHA biogenesis protein MshP [Ignavibacteria bacterium]